MGVDRNREQRAGRIAAALSASLNALSELQESQRRIEDRHNKSSDLLARYEKLWKKIENTQDKQYDIMKINKVNLVSNLEGTNENLRSIRHSVDTISQKSTAMEKKLESTVNEIGLFWGFLPKRWVLWLAIFLFGVLFGRAWGYKIQRDEMSDWHKGNVALFGPYDK